jgi:hypothetical protein
MNKRRKHKPEYRKKVLSELFRLCFDLSVKQIRQVLFYAQCRQLVDQVNRDEWNEQHY